MIPAPNWILEEARKYIVSYVGEDYFNEHIEIKKSQTNFNVDKIGAKYVIYPDYSFLIKGDNGKTIIGFKMWLDENGKVIKYEGPTKPYQFAISKGKAINIAEGKGLPSGGFARIEMGSTFGVNESYIWYASTEKFEPGTMAVYIDVDSGKVLGVHIEEEGEASPG